MIKKSAYMTVEEGKKYLREIGYGRTIEMSLYNDNGNKEYFVKGKQHKYHDDMELKCLKVPVFIPQKEYVLTSGEIFGDSIPGYVTIHCDGELFVNGTMRKHLKDECDRLTQLATQPVNISTIPTGGYFRLKNGEAVYKKIQVCQGGNYSYGVTKNGITVRFGNDKKVVKKTEKDYVPFNR